MKKSSTNRDIADLLANPPEWDLVGPTVEDDMHRAVIRYGAEAVKAAIKNITRPKLGRRQEKDWPKLIPVILEDARDWLAGGDPLKTRTSYSIARDFTVEHPGQSAAATHKRIERKLAKKPFDRLWFMLNLAESISRDEFPYAQHIRALEALVELDRPRARETAESLLKWARLALIDYEAKHGTPPPASSSMREIEDEVNGVVQSKPRERFHRGMFDAISQRK